MANGLCLEDKRRSWCFFLLLTGLFLLPYLAALLRLGFDMVADDPVFWCGRLIFPVPAAALICGLVSLFRRRIARRIVAVLLWLGVQSIVLLECFLLCFAGKTLPESLHDHLDRREAARSGRRPLSAQSVSLSGSRNAPVLRIGDMTLPLLPLNRFDVVGAEVSRHDRDRSSSFSFSSDMASLFQTSRLDPDAVRFLAARPDSVLHTLLGVPERDRYLLCVLRSGWVRCASAASLAGLRVDFADPPLPRAAEAEWEMRGKMFFLRGNGWMMPLFAANGAVMSSCVIFLPRADGGEKVLRIDMNDPGETREIRNMMASDEFTLLAPPDSPVHEILQIAAGNRSAAMRVRVDAKGKRSMDFFPFHGRREPGILRDDRRYLYHVFGKTPILLKGEAPDAQFANELAHVVKIDEATGRIRDGFSYARPEWSLDMLKNRSSGLRTLIFFGKKDPLLKKFYPDLAMRSVLFVISSKNIRHAVQYRNGDFRIPRPADPIDPGWPVSVRRAGEYLVTRWGDVSYIDRFDSLRPLLAGGAGYVIKVFGNDLIPLAAFVSRDPAWDQDIATSEKAHFVYLGSDRSKFPALLGQPVLGKYFLAVRRYGGWRFFWNDEPEFFIP
ncbi:MAG: hypothetical protein IJS01_10670 [Lentisphaeria bacterium]|nr:hypothetical protein [Lentisphaeria bacterium]